MPDALISCKNTDTIKSITNLLKECDFNDIQSATTASKTREFIKDRQFDLTIICTPLEDEFGLELVSDIFGNTDSSIIVIANADNTDEIQTKISFTNAFVLGRPLNKTVFIQSVKYVMLSRTQIQQLKDRNTELQQKMQDLKLVDRAKCMLIQYLRISESQAHRHIQKQAMDQRITQADVAKDILKTYEN